MEPSPYAAALAALPRRRDQLLPALLAVQAVAGWLPEAAITAAARHVYVPLSEVYGTVTGYSELRLSAPQPGRIELCTGLSCRVAGADAVREALPAGTHVEPVSCRFLCGVAPVAEQHGIYHGRLAPGWAGATPAPPQRRSTLPAATGLDGAMPARRAAAVERAQMLAARVRIAVADALCARAAGTAAAEVALLAAAQAAGAGPLLIRTGCDGNCHAHGSITVRAADGSEGRFARVKRADAGRVVAALRGGLAPEAEPYPGQVRRVLRNCGVIDPESLDEALAAGAYLGLEQARALPPAGVVERVRAAGLRGRGGAYFPTAVKWATALALPAPRYLVVNAEEGEPGVFKDRHLMESDPHALLEGMLIAAHALEVERIFLYINGQAALAAARMEQALIEAGAAGLLGSVGIEVYRGAGGYVCGEESVILNSIEGERPVPRPRPPLPVEAGLWGRPTVINNVETLAGLPLILTEGPEAFRQAGTADFPGTKLISLSGAVQRPGLYEVALGTPVRRVIELCGGGVQPGQTLTAAILGGPSGGFLPAELLDAPLVPGTMHPSGAVLGAGGIVVLDERTPVATALRELTAYNATESCGKCTPCREGTARALALLESGPLTPERRAELLALCEVMQTASLCGLGQMAPGPIRSALQLFA